MIPRAVYQITMQYEWNNHVDLLGPTNVRTIRWKIHGKSSGKTDISKGCEFHHCWNEIMEDAFFIFTKYCCVGRNNPLFYTLSVTQSKYNMILTYTSVRPQIKMCITDQIYECHFHSIQKQIDISMTFFCSTTLQHVLRS